MVSSDDPKPLTVEVDGKIYTGGWLLSRGTVYVSSPFGSRAIILRDAADPPDQFAQLLLQEIVRGFLKKAGRQS